MPASMFRVTNLTPPQNDNPTRRRRREGETVAARRGFVLGLLPAVGLALLRYFVCTLFCLDAISSARYFVCTLLCLHVIFSAVTTPMMTAGLVHVTNQSNTRE
jgi:glycerol-3-phosphate acyltransferase PlsY